jgi:predicted O-methyltransferase YrrM
MSKISKAFRAIGKIIRNPYLLNLVLDTDEEWEGYVRKHYPDLATGLPLVIPEDIFPGFEATIEPYAFLDGGSLPTDLGLLIWFARNIDRCKYFEIGTWRGESVANVARFAESCHTLNLSAGELQSLGMREGYIEQQGYFSRGLENVAHLQGNSLHFDFSSLELKFDLIFIDGDHHYESVKSDTEQVFHHLVHDHSVVVWHDYAHHPEKVRYEVMAGILDGCPAENHNRIYHMAHSKSAFFAGKEYPSSRPIFPLKYGKPFIVSIQQGS